MKFAVLRVLTTAMLIMVVRGNVSCTREGPICRDCEHRGYCVPNEDNNGFVYNEKMEEKCVAGWACDQLVLQCVRGGTCRYKTEACPENEFSEEVTFPSPYSCNEYVGCKGLEANYHSCSDGIAYDGELENCSADITKPVCYDYPVLCKEPGQKGMLAKFSYECVEEKDAKGLKLLYPKIIYDDASTTQTDVESSTVTDSEESSRTTSTGDETEATSPSSRDPNTTVQTTTLATTQKPFECEKEGRFKDPQNCMKFFWCIKDGNSFNLKHLTCRNGSHFDESKAKCVRGHC